MTKAPYIAHIQQANGNWLAPHLLDSHLRDVADLAKTLGAHIGSDWAELAGRWHDLGKYRLKFQDYIRDQTGYERENAHIENSQRSPHSTAGAIYLCRNYGGHLGPASSLLSTTNILFQST